MRPHPIAVDNYFVDREHTPLDEYGEKNYECLEAIDVKQFNKDMLALLAGERVELPVFNFKTGKREYKGDFLQLGADDILVIEGIHGLNDKLSYALPKESKFKIYISALTQLNVDEHNRIPSTDGRLLRRIVRMRAPEAQAQERRSPGGLLCEEVRMRIFCLPGGSGCHVQFCAGVRAGLPEGLCVSPCFSAFRRRLRNIWRQRDC